MSKTINVANASDKSWSRNSFLLWFGACGPTRVLVYADGLDDALEIAADWLADNAPGHLVSNDEHDQLCKEACEDADLAWPPPNDWCESKEYTEAIESAEADLTYTESGWITSYEWGICAENPTKHELIYAYHNLR